MATPHIQPGQYLLIIGAMKCGTTSLFDYLSGHPRICPARIKEPEYFSRQQGHASALSDYESLWDFDPRRHAWAMEASTGYTKFPVEHGVPERIHGHGLRPRFIYLVREPLARIESHYNFMLPQPGWDLPITHENLINTSRYHLQLSRFLDVFPRDDLLVLDFADLRDRPDQLLARVCSFLDIDDAYRPTDFGVSNPTDTTEPLDIALKRLGLGGATAVIPWRVKRSLRPWVKKWGLSGKRRLSAAERDTIRAALADDMAALHKDFAIDTTRWGF
ncbi:MAG: sulfotransferase domain-containing protein [Gammaproteobacteria bacterium]